VANVSFPDVLQSPNVLQSQIERQNEELKQDLMMLRFKLSPRVIKAHLREVIGPPALMKGIGNMLNLNTHNIKENTHNIKENVKAQVENAKDTVSSVASSLKDSLKEGVSSVKDSVSSVASSVKESMNDGVGSVKDGVGSMKDSVSSVTSSLKDNLGSAKESASSVASSVKDAVKDKTQYMKTMVTHNPWSAAMLASGVGLAVAGVIAATSSSRHQNNYNTNDYDDASYKNNTGSSISNILHDQPLLVGTAVLLAGAALGFLLPRSTYEQNLVGESSERFMRDVKERVQGTIAEARTTAKEQVEELKHVASDAGREMKQTVLNGMSSM
jgi:ElaB/YqjD/DUF883 family membrane-anchored ribosome-binding protein